MTADFDVASPNGLEYRILGPLEVTGSGTAIKLGGHRQRSVLALLLVNVNEAVSIDRIADELWEGRPPPTAVGTLRAYVANLRKALGGGAQAPIRTVAPGYVLAAETDRVDSTRFEELLRQSSRLASVDADHALACLDSALDLWRGPALADFAGEYFATAAASRLETLRLMALDQRFEIMISLGRHAEVIGDLQSLVRQHPLHEAFCAQLMIALYRCGRQAEALRQYSDTRQVLAEELGLDPGPQLRELEQAVLRHDPALALQVPRPAPTTPPPTPDSHPGSLPLSLFVGRTKPMAELRRLVASAESGHGGVVLIEGEAGAGKTRLTEELSQLAEADGVIVGWGRCLEDEGVPAYWPWTRSLSDCARQADAVIPPDMAALLSQPAVPDDKVPAGPLPASSSPAAERFRMFQSVVGLLAEIGRRGAVLVVLDDLQWADPSSLQLLIHLAREMSGLRCLIVGTLRDAALGTYLAGVLGQLDRVPVVTRIHLEGLDESAVAAFIEARVGVRDDTLVALVHEVTGGNALFVEEVSRTLVEQGAGSPGAGPSAWSFIVPRRVSEIVSNRVDSLPAQSGQLLSVAAVIGRSFSISVLARAADTDTPVLIDTIEAALADGLLEDDSGTDYRFRHDIVRRAVYDRISSIRRSRLHYDVMQALMDSGAGDDDRRVAEIAYHAYASAPTRRDRGECVQALIRAADQAMRSLAYEQGATYYGQAAEILTSSGIGQQEFLIDTLIRQGDAHWCAGNAVEARTTFERAIELADRTGDSAALARATIGSAGGSFRDWHTTQGQADPTLIARLEKALAKIEDGDAELRVRLLSMLAEQYSAEGRAKEAIARSDEAVAIGEVTGAHSGLAHAYAGRCVALWNPEYRARREEAVAEVLDLAAATGNSQLEHLGRHHRFVCEMERGEFASAITTLDLLERKADDLRHPIFQWQAKLLGALMALAQGRFAAGEQLAAHTFELGSRAGDPDAFSLYAAHIAFLHSERGDKQAMEAIADALAAEDPPNPYWQPVLCLFEARVGRAERAGAIMDGLAEDDFEAVPTHYAWLADIALLAEAATDLGDAARAAALYEKLLPHADYHALAADLLYLGPTSRYLGTLAALLGRFGDADDHFEAAELACRRAGAKPNLAWVLWRRAAARHAAGEQPSRIDPLIAEAVSIAESIGMGTLLGMM